MTNDIFENTDDDGINFLNVTVKQKVDDVTNDLLALNSIVREVSGEHPSADALCIAAALFLIKGGNNE